MRELRSQYSATTLRNGTIDSDVRVHRGTEKFFYMLKMLRSKATASFACLDSGATKYEYQRNPRNVGMTLLFAVLTKNDSFRSYSTFVYLLRAHTLNINTCMYTTSAHGHELSGCVRADAYNLVLIFAS